MFTPGGRHRLRENLSGAARAAACFAILFAMAFAPASAEADRDGKNRDGKEGRTDRENRAALLRVLGQTVPAPAGQGRVGNGGGAADFYHSYLLPRVDDQVSYRGSRGRPRTRSEEDHRFRLERKRRVVGRQLTRATRKAVKTYLIEAIELDRKLRLLETRTTSRVPSGYSSETPGGRFNLEVGFQRLLPKLELHYGMRRSAIDLDLGVRGNVGVEFSRGRDHRTRIHAAFDGDDRYRLTCRIAF